MSNYELKMEELVSEHIIEAGQTEEGVELLTGDAALRFVQQKEFRNKWQKLYKACPWATAFQSPGFVNTWYLSFSQEYFPVVVYQMEGEELSGLLCMGVPLAGKTIDQVVSHSHKLVGAGEFEAEYQVWLSRYRDGRFISDAIKLLQSNFPKCNIQFRYIPSKAPMGWLLNAGISTESVLQRHKRPLLDYGSDAAKDAFKINKQYKTKLNRLKRIGRVVFERVDKISEFSQILDDLAVHYDFRQGGMFNKNQFRDNPARKRFLLGLFREKVLHVTILRVDCQIIGAVGAVYGKGWLHLQGLNTHSPFVARHSPGILHFLHLGKYLEEENFAVFDLTPGGDKYKEKFATTHDEVYTLHISASPSFKTKKLLKKKLNNYLYQKGIPPMAFELKVQKKFYELKHRLQLLKNNFLSLIFNNKSPKIHWDKILAAPAKEIPVRQNDLNDLLDFNDANHRISRWEFMEKSMNALERGQSVYTWSDKGKLMAAVWVIDSEDKFGKDYPDGLTLHDAYYHPGGKEGFYSFLRAVVEEIQQNHPNRPIQAS